MEMRFGGWPFIRLRRHSSKFEYPKISPRKLGFAKKPHATNTTSAAAIGTALPFGSSARTFPDMPTAGDPDFPSPTISPTFLVTTFSRTASIVPSRWGSPTRATLPDGRRTSPAPPPVACAAAPIPEIRLLDAAITHNTTATELVLLWVPEHGGREMVREPFPALLLSRHLGGKVEVRLRTGLDGHVEVAPLPTLARPVARPRRGHARVLRERDHLVLRRLGCFRSGNRSIRHHAR